MAAWMQWFAKHADAIIDRGGPFTDRAHVGPGDDQTDVVGFMTLEAAHLDAARALVESSPAAAEAQRLEVLQVMDIPG